MSFIKKLATPLIFILTMGLLQRLLLAVLCYTHFDSIFDVFFAMCIGIIYDLSFFSVFLFTYIWLNKLNHKRIINFCFFLIIYLWVILNAFDFFSISYTGIRTSINSFNLFSFGDLIDKSFEWKIWLPFILFNIVFIFFLSKFKAKLLPNTEGINIKEKLATSVFLFILSFLYLPFPLNYYSNQVKISEESRQLALNPYYSWIISLMNSSKDYIMDKNLAIKSFKEKMGYSDQGSNFLERKVNYKDSSYEKVIIIVMESYGANRNGKLGAEKDLSPNFDSLSKEGILYTKCFACGPRTQYGISSILFGFPHFLGYNLFRQNKLRLPFHGLFNSMASNNYQTHFIHGGRANYDDMSLLLKADNISTIRDEKDIKTFKIRNSWGVDDESFFNYASDYISAQKGKNLFCVLSMSNHEPFEVPKEFKSPQGLKKSERAFFYSDYALGRFIEELKKNNEFQNSLIIITGDHGEHYSSSDDQTKLFHVPLLIIDHKQKGVVNNEVCSHSDIAEYILSKTSYRGYSHFIGQGLIDKNKRQVYYRDYDNNLFKVTDSLIYRYNLINKTLFKIYCDMNMYVKSKEDINMSSKEYESISDEIKVYITANKFIFENGLYK